MVTRTAERHPYGALGRMGVVAALHVCVLFVIARSLGIGTKAPEEKPLEGTFIDEPMPIEDPPQPIDDRTLIQQNTIVTPIEPPPPLTYEQETITGPPPTEDPRPQTGETFRVPEVVAVRPDTRYPLSQPPYPPGDIRAGNKGTADIEVYVLPTGRVGDARIVRSTGFDSLDRSALAEAKRNWRLLPATRDGVPVAQWHRLRVTFKLNQQ